MVDQSNYFKVTEETSGARLDVFLAGVLDEIPSRTLIKKLIDNGHVKVNEILVKAKYKVAEGDDVCVEVPDNFLTPKYVAPENIDLDVFYEDDYILVIDKPIGMTVHPAKGAHSGTLVNALLNYTNELSDVNSDVRPGIVHRLDKETSGLIVVAKDNITHTKLAKQFQRHTVQKQYVALVEGVIDRDEGVIDVPLGRHPRQHDKRTVSYAEHAKDAYTRYRVLARGKDVSLVALFPKTGRTHQLRVHMQYIKHPIMGDEKYHRKGTFERLALHARMIGFNHPSNKAWIEFATPVPSVFLKRLST